MAQNSLKSSSREVIIEIGVNGDRKTVDAIAAATKAIDDLKNAQKELKEQREKGIITEEEYYKQLALNKAEMKDQQNTLKANNKLLEEQVKAYKDNGNSLNAMRAQLKVLRAEYEDLSQAERESLEPGKGVAKLKEIDELTDKIKELEFAQQDYRRQVGEYDVVLKPAKQALRELRMECQNLAYTLKSTEGAIQAQQAKVQALASTVGVESEEYKKEVEILNQLNQSYKDTNANLTELEQKTGNLADTLSDSNKRIASFANDQQRLVAAQEGINALTSAYTALQGSLALLGVESKSMLEIYARIQVVQQSLNSLLVLYKALNKDSNLMIMARMKLEKLRLTWTNAYNAALAKQNVEVATNTANETANAAATTVMATTETAATGATFSLTAALQALNAVIKANPFLAIASVVIAAIVGIVSAVKKLNAANKEAEEQEKRLGETIKKESAAYKTQMDAKVTASNQLIKSYTEQIARVKTLYAIVKSEGAAYEAKKDALKELNKLVPEYNGYISETGKLMRDNSAAIEDYIKKLKSRAEAEAAMKLMTQAFETELEAQRNKTKVDSDIAWYKKEYDKWQKEYDEAILEGRDKDDPWLQKADRIRMWYFKRLQAARDYSEQLIKDIANAAKQVEYYSNNLSMFVDDSSKSTGSGSSKSTASNDESKQLEEVQKMYKELQDAARSYYTEIEKLQDDALQSLIRSENERYSKELETLVDAYNKAIDLTLKGDDFLKKAGIDPAALQRYITLLSSAMDEASARNKANVEKIKKDYKDAISTLENETQISFDKITTTLKNEIEKDGASEIELIRINLRQRLEALNAEEQAELSAHEYTEAQKTAITELYAKKRAMLTKNAAQAEKEAWASNITNLISAMSSATSAFSDLFSMMAENDEKMQKYANAMAYADIMVNMAAGIASAVAEGMKMGWPAAAIMIPLGIATVVGGITEAISVFKQAKVSNAPKFSMGGLVGNKTTTRTDDGVNARLSEGEYVIRSKVVKALGVDFFDKLNGKKLKKLDAPLRFSSGGIVPSMTTISNMDAQFNYDELKAVFKEAVAEVNPVVSVKEINEMQTRVSVKEQTASYN